MMQTNVRVLIIDNEDNVREELQAMLAQYQIRIIQGSGQQMLDDAKRVANQFSPHIVVIDLRLLDDYSDDRSGLAIAKDLSSASCILYSGYLTPEIMREAMERNIPVVGKREAPQKLIDTIDSTAQKMGIQPRKIKNIYWPASWNPTRIITTLFGEDATIPDEIVEDVLNQLFPNSKSLTLRNLEQSMTTPNSVTRGRSVVLEVRQNDRMQPSILKLAPTKDIVNEANRYRQYIQRNLNGFFHASIDRDLIFWSLGGIRYTFAGDDRQDTRAFAEFYQKNDDVQTITKPLTHLFTNVWKGLYNNSTPLETSLFEVYNASLKLESRLRTFADQAKTRVFRGLSMPLHNPVPWVLAHHEDSVFADARQAIIHGDLHSDNLFTDGEHAWVIDFERSGQGHILQDFVELEIDIITRLTTIENDDTALFYEFLVALVAPVRPDALLPITPRLLRNTHTQKALAVLNELRSLACQLTNYNPQEYYWGLLFDTLFVAIMAAENPSLRERTLLIGAIICERFRHWGDPKWPPQDWPQLEWLETPRVKKNTTHTGGNNMLMPEQQVSFMVLSEATKFLFSELGRRLDFWRKEKQAVPQVIELDISEPDLPLMKFDDVKQPIDINRFLHLQTRIKTSQNILQDLIRMLDDHRQQLLTDPLIDPKTRAYLKNRIPELETQISRESELFEGFLNDVYTEN